MMDDLVAVPSPGFAAKYQVCSLSCGHVKILDLDELNATPQMLLGGVQVFCGLDDPRLRQACQWEMIVRTRNAPRGVVPSVAWPPKRWNLLPP